MKRTPMLAIVVVGLAASAAHAEPDRAPRPPVKERSTLEVAPPGRAIKQLQIDNPLGDVRVEGYDGNALQIETIKQGPDADALERLRVSLVPNADGTVRIATRAETGPELASVPRNLMRIDLVIRAPRNVRIDATSSSGTLAIVNMDAGGELDTASGGIFVRNVQGEVFTHSLTGATSLTQVYGRVDAQSISANVDLDTITGEKLVASASHGRLSGRRIRSRDVELTTTDGKIILEGEATLRGHLVISSISGEIDVKLRRHGPVVVRARGTKVDLGVPSTSANGWAQIATSGDGEPAAVELTSRSGIVRFAFLQ
ncbi:MAG: DUF4097 family beta strand repeat-containing protein [Proteobacteria bacterium]|nr:DUF4097 family beta strand repeat-containing protein [Pseudomonadota bacterium]